MPKLIKIIGRSSSITNAFINSIIPVIYPTENEIKHALQILEIDLENVECAYCGEIASEWDHLRPLVKNQKPTGYISEIKNLVPACGKCNQSKGNKNWNVWISSDAKLSPKSKGVADLKERIKRLEKYEKWGDPKNIDFEKLVGKKLWNLHWQNWTSILEKMKETQSLAEIINKKIVENS
jgi:hypothetical protein